MKSHTSIRKASRTTTAGSMHHSSARNTAVALTPPDYGIEFVDQGLVAEAGPLVPREIAPIQRQGGPEEEELLQRKFDTVQGRGIESDCIPDENNTGLPDNLKSGIESLSGISLNNVKVHYNSTQPAQLNALAYAQGTDIHIAPGQEPHLPHEAWHVVQQAQVRVKPKLQAKGTLINDDPALEHEADVMGRKAAAGVVQADEQKARPGTFAMAGATFRQLKRGGAFDENAHWKLSTHAVARPESIQRKKTRLSEEEKISLGPYDAKYDECKNRGENKIWPAIAEAAKGPLIKKEVSEPTVGEEKKEVEAKATNKQRFEAEYDTEIVSQDHKTGVYVIKSAAKAEKKEDSPPASETEAKSRVPSRRIQPAKEKRWQYTNSFDVKRKQITAKGNWADEDPTPKRLNNSEILWFQYQIAAQLYQDNNKLTDDQSIKLRKVKDLFRDNVTNPETRAVVDLAYPNGKSWRKGHSHTWKPTSPDFFAVLGTPNGQAAGWMLAQHMFEMEGRRRKITEIAAEGSKTMELKLKIHLQRDKSSS